MTDTLLELATTPQLIAELCRRQTFQGVVLSRSESYKGEWQGAPLFNFDINNLTYMEALRLMDSIAAKIRPLLNDSVGN